MSRILVPLDGSEIATRVLPHVRTLAATFSADVHLVHVVTHGDEYHMPLERGVWGRLRPDSLAAATVDELAALRESAATYLEQQAEPLRAAGLTVGCSVLEGRADEAIVGAAEDALMIAMASHGYSGIRRWALGSVTDKVAHTAHVPVLVIRTAAPAEYAIHRILVPLDGSETARQALPTAIQLARTTHAELVLLAVAAPPIGSFEVGLAPNILDERDRAAIRDRLLSELVQAHADTTSLRVSTLIIEGFVAEEISDQAERLAADLIVMSSHGYGGFKRLALGSVTDKVMHITHTPLLVVHR